LCHGCARRQGFCPGSYHGARWHNPLHQGCGGLSFSGGVGIARVGILSEGLVQKIALHEREHRECFDELTLLQTRSLELCLTIIGPPRAKRMYEGMRLATLHHNEMARELAAFQAAMSSTMELVLRHSPNNVARAEVVGELVAELHRVEAQNSSGPLPRSMTFCSDHCSAGPGWSTIWKRLPGALGWSWTHGGRWRQSWTLCSL
jgi:hypothetical protein